MSEAHKGARILLIEDEPQIRKLLKVTLQAHQYDLLESGTGSDGLLQASMNHPDLILLDLGLPDGPGLEVLKRIRQWSPVPVIVLTAKDREEDKIEALDSGADDYVTKPFSMGELVARIRVALRHAVGTASTEPVLRFGELTIDLAQRLVERSGNRIKLTPTEYDLLKTLALNAGKVMTQKQLLRQVWGSAHLETEGHYLRIYVGHLRKKLDDHPADPIYIATEPGIGYRFLLGEGRDAHDNR
ncbi:response regulator [Paenibacillus herberti]|uniref:Transcriptional regulatory protein KdpE n=1 Tax=Paenibacillus herberti TaxID=1619309 RepID=A0A229P4K3_9BACL|nr:response regulator [Paenibacillus herberti]OXM16789.1 DNA-binding response regulator [Paenibacillus herberti]